MPAPTYTGTLAISGLGAYASINTGTVSTPVWTPLGEARKLGLSGRKNNLADATTLLSAQKEFVGTLPDPGKYAINGNYVPTDPGQKAIEAAILSGLKVQIEVQLPKAGTQTTTGNLLTFFAIVEENNWPADIDPTGLMSWNATVQISGAVTTTPGS